MFIDSYELDIWKSEFDSDFKLLRQDDEHLDQVIRSNIADKENRSHCRKRDEQAAKLRLNGNEKVGKNQWWEAMKLFNNSLCESTIGSANISLAYANRSLCFLKLQMYDKCLADIELATNANYPKQSMSKLEQRWTYSMEQIKKGMQFRKEVPKLDFEEDPQFPGMANVLQFRYDENFGPHLIAKRDIDVGNVVLVEDAFVATPVMSTSTVVCSNCFKVSMNFISCENCTDAMFCSQACAQNDKFHEISCGNSINYSDHLVPYAVRSVLLAINIFPDIDTLIKFVKGVLNESKNETPLTATDLKSKYRMFLRLNFELLKDFEYCFDNRSYDLFVELMSQPAVKERIQTKNQERFLMFLSVIHMNILYCNSFQHQVAGFLFLIYNYFNRNTEALAPNLLQYTSANKMVLTTSRQIKRGDPLLIKDARPEKCCVAQTRFKCRIHTELYGESHILGCDGHPANLAYNFRRIESSKHINCDRDYENLLDEMKRIDYSNDLKCSNLRQKCIELLKKYHQWPWCIELEKVYNIFEKIAFENYFY